MRGGHAMPPLEIFESVTTPRQRFFRYVDEFKQQIKAA
jgi:hypothetical protein